MLTPAARSVLVVQTWFTIGASPIIPFFSGLYATEQFEPGWLLLLPVTFATAWFGMRSSFLTFVALLYPGADPRRAKRVLIVSYSVGLVVAVVALTAGAMLL